MYGVQCMIFLISWLLICVVVMLLASLLTVIVDRLVREVNRNWQLDHDPNCSYKEF